MKGRKPPGPNQLDLQFFCDSHYGSISWIKGLISVEPPKELAKFFNPNYWWLGSGAGSVWFKSFNWNCSCQGFWAHLWAGPQKEEFWREHFSFNSFSCKCWFWQVWAQIRAGPQIVQVCEEIMLLAQFDFLMIFMLVNFVNSIFRWSSCWQCLRWLAIISFCDACQTFLSIFFAFKVGCAKGSPCCSGGHCFIGCP